MCLKLHSGVVLFLSTFILKTIQLFFKYLILNYTKCEIHLLKNSTAHRAMTFLEIEQYIKSVYFLALGLFIQYSTKFYVPSNNNFLQIREFMLTKYFISEIALK